MEEIKDIAMTRLKKGAHVQFMNVVKEVIEADSAAVEKGGATLTAFSEALAKEKKEFAVSRKSLKTDELRRADKARDKYFATMKKVVMSSQNFPLPDVAEAAKKVAVLIKGYNVNTRAQLDEESGKLGKITDQLRGPLLAEATALGINAYVDAIVEQNELVRQKAAERQEEKAGKTIGAVKKNRAQTDMLYRQLVKLLNAYAYIDYVTTGSSELEPIIRRLNTEVKHYKQQALKG